VHHIRALLAREAPLVYEVFSPSVDVLGELPTFVSKRPADCDVWRGQLRALRGVGPLPVIAQRPRDS
jgi:hypothetical protein